MADLMPCLRTDLFVTTALKDPPALIDRAQGIAAELNAPFVARRDLGLPRLFDRQPDAERVLIVQADRLVLVHRSGEELFYHPNMAYLRIGNLQRGGNDFLIEVAQLQPGDSLLDCTLGFAAEAILCSYAVGETGEVHGVEAIPEIGVLVREGLQSVVTDSQSVNQAMRHVQVVHLGHHLEYLRRCPDRRYDVVCFDPFFNEVLEGSSHSISPLRFFGSHEPLLRETIEEARRVARRRVIVKAEKHSDALEKLGITNRMGARSGKVAYGIVIASDD